MDSQFKLLSAPQLGLLLVAMSACSLTHGACSFTAPEKWIQANTRWEGSCPAGSADGFGVLKEYSDGKVVRFFFGQVNKGEIEIGVVDQAEGFIAGKFSHGVPVSSEDRQTYVDAFTVAEKAAKQASSQFRDAGNKASAQFYENKAKELSNQLD